jgi:hydrogenase maturation protein HypF
VSTPSHSQGRRIEVRGTVQGVGFRPWVYRLATALGLAGCVRNHARGVTIEAFGPPAALDEFVARLRREPPPAASLDDLRWTEFAAESPSDFTIVESRAEVARRVSIPPDLATCDDCAREVLDPSDRRFGYPFTNCTNCGPRFTITRDVPYDRAATTMAAFRMCARCQAEYDAPRDRRFHAEPNACPACGPRISLLGPNGEAIATGTPIEAAARAIEAGLIVAVKGIGGFHLACDASSEAAVARLRERKRREEKPFAVMVPDLADAGALAHIGEAERRLLTGVERPIVLARQRRGAPLALNVAPGNRLVGLLLPYTPLHALLLRAVGRPVVMTSGNLSEEPLAYRNDEACERLAGLADLFLAHDRDIVAPCDDSVARVVARQPALLRRSRGYVPRAVSLARPLVRPVLACGALLKNTFCLAAGEDAWLGPHVGDLDNLATTRFFEESVERLSRFLAIRPEVVAHDLHPEYASTAYARRQSGVAVVGVQHHHAHVVSALAEHRLEGPVLGLAWDGTGYGLDGTSWGGELLLADDRGFERLATFRPLRLAGGDQAIRQVWRTALALLLDACGPDAPLDLPVFERIAANDLRVVRQLIEGGLQAPLAHGVGRYFDAVGALVLGRRVSSYEGQVALELNLAGLATGHAPYPFDLQRETTPWQVDLRPAVRAILDDLRARVRRSVVAARFHDTLAEAGLALVEAATARTGRRPVVLTGGCFQNARLAEALHARLARRGHAVYLHRLVPPGDGGIALGQALVADRLAHTV